MKHQNLFDEFKPATKDQWKDQAIRDLKGGDFSKLVWKTYEGFDIQPFYTSEDLAGLDYLNEYENTPPKRKWENRENIRVSDPAKAAEQIAEAVHGGATGLALLVEDVQKALFDELFKKTNIEGLPVNFVVERAPAGLLQQYFEYLKKKNISIEDAAGSLLFDPIAAYSLTGKLPDERWSALAEAVKAARQAPRFYPLTVNNGFLKDSGASVTEEIAFTLNIVVAYVEKLKALGIQPEETLSKLQLSTPVGVDYFMEIAKLKTFRILIAQVARAYGLAEYDPASLRIHCYSSLWSKTIFDPSVNLLRDTTEAMSAIIGGCDALTIEPYDATFKKPQPFLRRIARNVSTIIKDEAYLDKVADPVAGSYYLENLIDEQVKAGWRLFQEVEEAGGYLRAFEKGMIHEKIKTVRQAKRSKLSARRDVIVGTNQYPNLKETIDPDNVKAADDAGAPNTLRPERAAKDFEELRLDTEKYVKKNGERSRPAVYLAEVGDQVAMRKARAAFSGGFFGAAGFNVVSGKPSADIDQAMEQLKKVEAGIVVLCAADEDYAAQGEAFAEKFKAGFPEKILVLAGYPAEIVDRLKQAGFDDFIHVRSQAVESLRNFQKKLSVI